MVIENSNRLELRMLGIDPGLQCTGWGIIVQDGLKLTHLAHGAIRTEVSWSFASRLNKIHNILTEVIKSLGQFLGECALRRSRSTLITTNAEGLGNTMESMVILIVKWLWIAM